MGAFSGYPRRIMASVRFCPFCRKPFEDQPACPEHGLLLVDFQALPPVRLDQGQGGRFPVWTLRHGRGWLLLAASLFLVGFFLPLAAMHGAVEAESSLLRLALGRAKTLWIVPVAGCALVALFARRRTIASLRAVRLVVALLSLFPAGVVLARWFGARAAAVLMSERAGELVELTVGLGSWSVFVGAACGLLAAVELGTTRSRPLRVEQVEHY